MLISNLKSKFNSLINESSKSIDDDSYSSPTIIAKGLSIVGELTSNGVIEIEGNIKGTIRGSIVTLREGCFVDGTIIADFANVKGQLKGVIKAKNVSIFQGAEIVGTIEYESIVVEDGACLDAQFKIISR